MKDQSIGMDPTLLSDEASQTTHIRVARKTYRNFVLFIKLRITLRKASKILALFGESRRRCKSDQITIIIFDIANHIF